MSYQVLLVFKFVSIVAYASGFAGAFLTSSLEERRRAVHNVAGPALLSIWLFGYFLSEQQQVPLTELWILGALTLSSITQIALSRAVTRDERTLRSFVAAAIPFVLVLVLMVFRPTWSMLRS
jgi:hypothetical protein